MVQREPNLTLTLEALGSSGALLSTESKAALTHSIPLKKAELAVQALAIWGRVHTRNGRDYIVASTTPSPRVEDGTPVMQTLYFVSQDGTSWSDLPAVDSSLQATALKVDNMLQGDPAHKFFWPPKPEDEEEAGEEEEGKPKVEYETLTELQRLRCMIDMITDATNLAPVGSQIVNAHDDIIPNPLFPGVSYPDKLEAFYHQHHGPSAGTAADDVRGSWALQHDSFKEVTICRNLLFLGYSFYYSHGTCTWGGFYNGDGLKNKNLVFML